MLRLQKFLAQAGLGSRRSCEQLIKDNKVYVNGKVAILGTKVSEADEVTFEGERVLLKTADLKVIMLNKPRGILSSRKDDKKIKLVFDFLPKVQNEPDWIAVGRLDINTSGLVLITNDGKLANDIIHPTNEIEREYIARVRGKPSDSNLKKLMSGITIDKEKVFFTDLVKGKETTSHTWFALVIMSGKNRSVRKLWESIGHEVSRLKRVRLGKLFLPKELKEGKFRRI